MPNDSDLQQHLGQIDQLVAQIQSEANPEFRDRAIKLVELLLEVHGAGLDRIMELTTENGPAGNALVDRFVADPLLSSLLLLHGLHPVDFETRVRQALDKVRPYLMAHKGNVELLGVEDGVIRLRLEGSCNGCPSSSQTLKNAIIEALDELAPDSAGLEVEGVVPPKANAVFVPLTPLQKSAAPKPAARVESLGREPIARGL